MTDEEIDKTEKEYKEWLVHDHKLLDNPTYCDIEQKCFRAFFAGTRYGLAEGRKEKLEGSRMTVTFYNKSSRDLSVYKDITKIVTTRFSFILHKGKELTISIRRKYNVLLEVNEWFPLWLGFITIW